jgi:hypothetical protein
MAVRNLAWNASNASRFHPFDESATLLDDAGTRPPLQIVTDLKLLVPESAGRYVYVGGISVTANIVTVLFLASDGLYSKGNLIATISQKLPVNRFYPYQLSASIDGIGGWISFGDLADLTYQGRFSLPVQSFLSPLVARPYRVPPIPWVRSEGGSTMTGLVRLSGGHDIEVVKECREVPGHGVATYHESYCGSSDHGTQVRDVIVVRLKDKTGVPTRNVFDLYKGPCGKRPSSRTCGTPDPIEFLGPTPPDCNGNITIRLQGCLDMLEVKEVVTVDDNGDPVFSEDASGVLLACGMTLDDACIQATQLPDSEGRLPNEYDNACEDESITSLSDSAGPDQGFSFDTGEALAEEIGSISEPLDVIDDWVIHFGFFSHASGKLVGGSFSRNVATYEPVAAPAGFYKKATAKVQLISELPGSLHNASVVANFNNSYFVAEIDWDGHYRGFKMFRIAEFDGSQWLNIYAVAVPTLQLGDLYDLSLSVLPHEEANKAWLVANLKGITNPGIDLEIGPVAVSGYGTATGYFGIGSNRSAANFDNFRIQSITTAP